MIWSKLKKTVEDLLAESLKGRLRFHAARYGPGVSHVQVRAWIALDGREIARFSTPEWDKHFYPLVDEIRESTGGMDFNDPDQRQAYYAADKAAQRLLSERGIYERQHLFDAMETYVGLPIAEAIHSSNAIVRALAMLDRRLGKRRLRVLSVGDDEAPLVKTMYHVRCQAEGIGLPASANPSPHDPGHGD